MPELARSIPTTPAAPSTRLGRSTSMLQDAASPATSSGSFLGQLEQSLSTPLPHEAVAAPLVASNPAPATPGVSKGPAQSPAIARGLRPIDPSPAPELPTSPAPIAAKLPTGSIAPSAPDTGDETANAATPEVTEQPTAAENVLLSTGPISAAAPAAAAELTVAPSGKPNATPKNMPLGRSKQPSTDPAEPAPESEGKAPTEPTPLPAAPAIPAAPVPTQPVAPAQTSHGKEPSTPTDAAAPVAGAALDPAEPHRAKPTMATPAPSTPPEPTATAIVAPEVSAAPTPPHAATTTPLQALPTVAASPSQAAPPAPPPSPALQVAQAVADPVRIVLAAPTQQSGAPHVTTIQLDPVELGRVEIRIERTTEGPVKIELAAERPETLLRLLHDQPQLQQALDQAGIPQQGRSVSFSLASDSGTGSTPSTNLAGDNASSGNGQRSQQSFGNQNGSTTVTDDTPIPIPTWSRTGLDITA